MCRIFGWLMSRRLQAVPAQPQITAAAKSSVPSVAPKAELKVPFELPVPIEKLAEIFGWEQAWIHEKVRDDPRRNPNPMPHHKPGKYLMFYPSEVNSWVKAS